MRTGDNVIPYAARLAVALGVARLLFGLLVLWMSKSSGEAHMLLLLDFVTIGLYFALAAVGLPMSVADATDMRFLIISVLTWSALGFVVGVLVARRRRSRSATVDSGPTT